MKTNGIGRNIMSNWLEEAVSINIDIKTMGMDYKC